MAKELKDLANILLSDNMKSNDIISLIINQLTNLLNINISDYDILVRDEPKDISDIASICSHEHDIILISLYAF